MKYSIRRVGRVAKPSRPFADDVSLPLSEDSTVNFEGSSAEPLTEGVGESPYKLVIVPMISIYEVLSERSVSRT